MKNKTETDHKRHVRQYKIVRNINSCNWSPRRTGERKLDRRNTLKDNKNFLEKGSNTQIAEVKQIPSRISTK